MSAKVRGADPVVSLISFPIDPSAAHVQATVVGIYVVLDSLTSIITLNAVML